MKQQSPVPSPDPIVRLRPTVEAFPASDGHLYLLHGGATADFVIRDVEPRVLALFESLGEGPAAGPELCDRLARRGFTTTIAEIEETLEQLRRAGLLESDDPSITRMSAEDRERYDRQLAYFAEIGDPDQDRLVMQSRLAQASVAVVGVGGLGSWTVAALACAGIGRIVLIDGDTVALSNLNRQLLFDHADLGALKVERAASALEAFNPSISVETYPEYVTSVDQARRLFAGSDAVVATADQPAYEINRWINTACCQAGIPWIAAGQFPPHLRVGPLYIPGETACLECQERNGRRRYPLYDELATWRQSHPTLAATVGFGSGLIGTMIAGELVHRLTGLVPPATAGRAITINMTTLESTWVDVVRDLTCPLCSIDRGC